jgi:hypothetical protein
MEDRAKRTLRIGTLPSADMTELFASHDIDPMLDLRPCQLRLALDLGVAGR